MLMIAALLAFAFGSQMTVAAAQQVPRIDVTPSCRAAASGILGVKPNIDSCMATENAARDKIAEQWSKFSAADRASCVALTTTGTSGTYTELLTCLEIKRDARALPKESVMTGTEGQSRRRRR
jgi:hypothetical protein